MRTMLCVLATIALATGCDEKKPKLPPAAQPSASASAVAPSASTRKFAIDGASKATLLLDAPIEKIKASATNGAGELTLDPTNLAASRGTVKIDLTTLTTSTFAEASKNTLQTQHARTWLEVGDGEDGKLDEKTKEANRWAVYTIRGIENASATDLTKVAPTKDGADDVRAVTLTTKGDILVHGAKADRDADVELKLRYDAGAPADAPKALTITSRKPFRVVLAEHDVKPRDTFGRIAKDSFHLLGTKVGDNADITLDLRAKPQP